MYIVDVMLLLLEYMLIMLNNECLKTLEQVKKNTIFMIATFFAQYCFCTSELMKCVMGL